MTKVNGQGCLRYEGRTVLLIGLVWFMAMLAGCSSDSGDSQNGLVMAYTFETGTEGWVAGFADLPADASPEFYELESSHQPLPSELPGYGIYIQGNNHSDDLFMYLKTQVEGLRPNSTYRKDLL